jgi:hypothetical protein
MVAVRMRTGQAARRASSKIISGCGPFLGGVVSRLSGRQPAMILPGYPFDSLRDNPPSTESRHELTVRSTQGACVRVTFHVVPRWQSELHLCDPRYLCPVVLSTNIPLIADGLDPCICQVTIL